METISKDANAVLSGVSPEARAYAIANAPGSNLTSGEASRLTSEFLSANSGAATQVYSAPNIAQTTTAPVAAPNLSDPFGLYNYYMNTPDITAAKESAKTAQAQLLERTKAAREQQQALGQNLQSTNRIRGNQQNAQQLATNDIQALNEAYTLAASNVDALTSTAKEKMAIAEQSRNEIKSLIAQTGGKAGISYADNYESAVKKADTYIKKQEKEAKKEAYKDSLKQTALQLGIKTNGKNTKELEKSLKKYYKSEKEYNDKIKSLDLQAKKQAIVKAGSATAPGASSELSAVAKALKENNNDWGATANYLASKGYDVSSGSVIDNELRRRNNLPPITTASTKPATAAQSLASGFASRLESSGRILSQFSDLGSSMFGTVSGSGWFPNVLKSSDRQRMEQAQRDFVNAQLRRESGAVISDSEFDNAAKQYFPQPGDSDAVIAQKNQARNIAIQNMKNAAGNSYSSSLSGEQDINDILSQFGL
jgi:hypothetical protein